MAHPIERLGAATRTDDHDEVADEAPLDLRIAGQVVATLMRTPGHDRELVTGLLAGEGIVGSVVATGAHTVDIDADPAAFRPRGLVASAACGVCGRPGVADLELRAQAVASDAQVAADVVRTAPDRLRPHQPLFAQTGGVHAAGLMDLTGAVTCVREDVGRHNAVDKVVGWARLAGHPMGASVLVLSGRCGYELVQKAVMAGIPVVVSVSAPTTLAIAVAERFGVALCGFVRDGRANVYSHGWRIRS